MTIATTVPSYPDTSTTDCIPLYRVALLNGTLVEERRRRPHRGLYWRSELGILRNHCSHTPATMPQPPRHTTNKATHGGQ